MSGHPVFPCEGKVPVKGWKWTEATITSHLDPRLKQFNEWSWPTQRWLVVFDIDHPEHWPYDDPDELLKQHAGQRTQSGGYHLVMIDTHPEPDSVPAQVREPWGEIRRKGTYHRLYEPNTNWLHKNYLPVPDGWRTGAHTKPLAAPEERQPGAREKRPPGGNVQSKALVVTEDITTPAQEGSRNIRLTSYVGALHKRGTPWLEMVEKAQALNSSYEPPLAEDEVLAICRSVARYPAGNPKAEFPAGFQPGSNSTAQTGRFYLSAAEVQAMDIPPVRYDWEVWAPSHAIMLSGYSGSGKSLFALHAARQLASRGKRVLLMDAEQTWQTIQARLGTSPAPNLFYMAKDHLEDRKQWMELDYSEFDYTFLDTKDAAYQDENAENTAEHWVLLNKWITHWVNRGVSPTILHHSGKDEGRRQRGSSAAVRAMDTVLNVKQEPDENRFFTSLDKDRHGIRTGEQTWTYENGVFRKILRG
jgi:hypothetical protein